VPMGGLGGDQLESAGQAEGSSHSGGRLGRFAADGVTFPQAKGFLDQRVYKISLSYVGFALPAHRALQAAWRMIHANC